MDRHFCPITMSLLVESYEGQNLVFKSPKVGYIYQIAPDQTLISGQGIQDITSVSKYKNTLRSSAFNPVISKQLHPCDNCGRQIMSMQRIGEQKKVVYSCICGNSTSS
jgi:hypothetical protein